MCLAFFGLLRDLLQDLNVVDIAEADIVLRFRQALDGRDKGVRAGRYKELVIGELFISVQQQDMVRGAQADRFSPLHPLHFV